MKMRINPAVFLLLLAFLMPLLPPVPAQTPEKDPDGFISSEIALAADLPWVTIPPVTGCYSENAEIPYMLYDKYSRPTSIYAQYSLDGGKTWNWAYTTRPMNECMRNLTTSPQGVLHYFPWYSQKQATCELYDKARIRILPFNSGGSGAWISSGNFCLDNLLQLPRVSVLQPALAFDERAFIPIYYQIFDCQSEPTNIVCKYSRDGGATWNWAYEAPGSQGQKNQPSSPDGSVRMFLWDAAANLGAGTHSDVQFSILPSNTKGVSGFWKSPVFRVKNALGPWVNLYAPSAPVSGTGVTFWFHVFDHKSKPVNISAWFSTDGGNTWAAARTADGSNVKQNLPASRTGVIGSYFWDMQKDLNVGNYNVLFGLRAYNTEHGQGEWSTVSLNPSVTGPETLTINLPGNIPLILKRIPAGSFQMGSPGTERSRGSDEGPVHTVTLPKEFYLGQTEVTQKQWLSLMKSWPGTAPSYSHGMGDNNPAYYVSWNDVQGFISALNNHISSTGQGPLTLRLPSEAEWEYACRAGTTTRFYFGDSLGVNDDCADDGIRDKNMWFCGNKKSSGSQPVGSKLPNAFGLYDMAGSVQEWCQDWYHSSYAGAPSNGSAWVSPATSNRVLRDNDWGDLARKSRSAARDYASTTYRCFCVGFRLATVRP